MSCPVLSWQGGHTAQHVHEQGRMRIPWISEKTLVQAPSHDGKPELRSCSGHGAEQEGKLEMLRERERSDGDSIPWGWRQHSLGMESAFPGDGEPRSRVMEKDIPW